MDTRNRILELGTGTGILGMTISKLGNPACVVLTDGDEKAVSLLKDNLADPFNSIDSDTVKARFLLWGYDHVAEFTDWCRQAYDGSKDNNENGVWKKPDTPVKMDCIIAGDVMYKRELPPLFFATVDALLVSTGGTLWLCHVPRATVTHEVVQQAARDAGFVVETIDLTTIPPVEGCPLEDSSRAKVYRITRQ
jgi:predicted nicotinamide N-methyase